MAEDLKKVPVEQFWDRFGAMLGAEGLLSYRYLGRKTRALHDMLSRSTGERGRHEPAGRVPHVVRRQVQVTFQYDPIGVANRHFTGMRCLMWGSDYPHHEGTWPNSQEAVAKQFAGVPDDEIDQIVRMNAALTFGFDA